MTAIERFLVSFSVVGAGLSLAFAAHMFQRNVEYQKANDYLLDIIVACANSRSFILRPEYGVPASTIVYCSAHQTHEGRK